MRFSIITIVYNDESNVRETILSVLLQSYKNIQYICIDGGSSDNTLSIINEYRDSIGYIISEKDDGIADAFNKGIRAADGDFILILNSGDVYVDQSSISTLADLIKLDGARHDMYSCDSMLVDECGPVRVFKSRLDKLTTRMSVSHNGLAIKRDVYNELGGYDIKYKIAMDYDLITRYLSTHKVDDIFSLNFPLTTYKLGGVSDSRSALGFYESYKTKVTNGHNAPRAFLYFILLCINHRLSSFKGKYIKR